MTERTTSQDFKQLRRSHAKELHAAALTASREAQKYIRKIDALNQRIDYYRKALAIIAEPLPLDALHKPTWQGMGRLLAERSNIAARALREERIERESPAVAGPASGEVLDADRTSESREQDQPTSAKYTSDRVFDGTKPLSAKRVDTLRSNYRRSQDDSPGE